MNIDLQGNVLIRHQSIPDCQKCEESKKILDQNKIKYTIITRSGGFQQIGCKSPIN